ncbi:MAG TPA: hypothetical protein VKO18_12210 [Terriglobia bacterium]|nr:hypothetical protein [Terriglobia bacterium]
MQKLQAAVCDRRDLYGHAMACPYGDRRLRHNPATADRATTRQSKIAATALPVTR